MWWGCAESRDMLEYEVMRLPMSLKEVALFWSFSDLNRPWVSLDRIYEEGLDVVLSTSIGYDGKDRFEN
jgi:hypothetical protein